MRLGKRVISLLLCLCLVCSVYIPQSTVEVKAADNIATVTGNRNEALIFSYLTEKMGLNSAAACGILANVYRECRFNEKASGAGEISYGICQWYAANCDRLKAYCAENRLDYTTLSAQLYFLQSDLQKRFPKLLATLKNVTNTAEGAYEAAYAFCYNYERPRSYQTASVSRGELARDTFWPVFGGRRLILELDASEHKHTYITTTEKATLSENGCIRSVCSVCGDVQSTKTISRIAKVKLSSTSYVYSGKSRKPTVTVTDAAGKKISSSNYTVSYSGNRKSVGVYKVTVTFKGNYSGKQIVTFKILPKSTSLKSVTAKKKSLLVKWKKNTTQTTGYELQFSKKSKFNDASTKTITLKNKTTSKTLTQLLGKTRYYVRIRTYKKVTSNGNTVKLYSAWSKVKNTKTKA